MSRAEDPMKDWLPNGPRGAEAYGDMASQLSSEGLLTPPVPRAISDELMTSEMGWAWGTDVRWTPWAAYSLFNEAAPSILPHCLAEDAGDFWLFAQRGHGVNSHAIGMVARVGPVLIAQQHSFGGVYGDHERQTQTVNDATRGWTQTLAELEHLPSEELRCVVLYSDYRGYATIATLGNSNLTDFGTSEHDLLSPFLPGWRVLIDPHGVEPSELRNDLEVLLVFAHYDAAVALATRHLMDLVEAGG